MGWPACLSYALEYLYRYSDDRKQGIVQHKELKPSIILIKDRRVVLADFSISNYHALGYTTGTSGPASGTPK
jgi:hypothetical protein